MGLHLLFAALAACHRFYGMCVHLHFCSCHLFHQQQSLGQKQWAWGGISNVWEMHPHCYNAAKGMEMRAHCQFNPLRSLMGCSGGVLGILAMNLGLEESGIEKIGLNEPQEAHFDIYLVVSH